MHVPPGQAAFIPAHLEPHLSRIRELFNEYRAEADNGVCFQTFEAEMAALPGHYAPPEGALILVEWEGTPAACAALRPLEPGICELKRVYVRPAYRGKGLGRLLVERFLERARILGYREVRLDTLPSMQAAATLYRSLGFEDRAPYGDDPTPGAQHFSIALH
ncbi:MAG: GNAT family N-acetyltransferase [Rhodothermales bacterium]